MTTAYGSMTDDITRSRFFVRYSVRTLDNLDLLLNVFKNMIEFHDLNIFQFDILHASCYIIMMTSAASQRRNDNALTMHKRVTLANAYSII